MFYMKFTCFWEWFWMFYMKSQEVICGQTLFNLSLFSSSRHSIKWLISCGQLLDHKNFNHFFFSFVFCLVQPNQKIITLRFGHLMTFSVPVHQWQLMKLHMLELWLVMFLSIDKVAVLVNILGHDRDLIYRSSWSTGNVIKATIVYVG